MLNIESRPKRALVAGSLTALGFLAAGCGSKANSNPAPSSPSTTVSGGENGTSVQTSQPETPPTTISASPTDTKPTASSQFININFCKVSSVDQEVRSSLASVDDCSQEANSTPPFESRSIWVTGQGDDSPPEKSAEVFVSEVSNEILNPTYAPNPDSQRQPLKIDGKDCNYITPTQPTDPPSNIDYSNYQPEIDCFPNASYVVAVSLGQGGVSLPESYLESLANKVLKYQDAHPNS